MPDIAIVSGIYGAYDKVRVPVPQTGIDAEYIIVTDNPDLAADGWRIVYDPSIEISVKAAKFPKMFPWEFTTAPASIWIDGNIQVMSQSFAVEAMAYIDPIGQFRHRYDCCYLEAEHTRQFPKYDDQWDLIDGMVARYRALGHPEHWGLWCGNVIGRKHTPQVKAMCLDWAIEIDEWCHQDQISEPFALRQNDLRPTFFPGLNYANPWLKIMGHNGNGQPSVVHAPGRYFGPEGRQGRARVASLQKRQIALADNGTPQTTSDIHSGQMDLPDLPRPSIDGDN